VGEAEKVAKFYHPVQRMDGSEVTLGVSERGSACGVWVEQDGRPVVEMVPA
jgi:phytanoyl-CoA hydroxylase